MRTSLIAVRTSLVMTSLIALSLTSLITSPVYAGKKAPPLTKAEKMNLCLLISSGCIKNCGSGEGAEQCLDFCIAEESQCYARARIDVIGSQNTISGGGVAVQTPLKWHSAWPEERSRGGTFSGKPRW